MTEPATLRDLLLLVDQPAEPSSDARESIWNALEHELDRTARSRRPFTTWPIATGRVSPHARRSMLAVAAVAALVAALLYLTGGGPTRLTTEEDLRRPTVRPEEFEPPSPGVLHGFGDSSFGEPAVRAIRPGGRASPAAPGPLSETFTATSPISDEIIFNSDRDGDWELYLMNADGSNVRQITHNDFIDVQPAWSPDGKKIAFNVGNAPGHQQSQIYVMNADGTERKRIVNIPCSQSCAATNPAWSPDGRYIAYSLGSQYPSCQAWDDCSYVWVVSADGSERRRITTGAYPHWSPNGSKLVFVDFAGTEAVCDDGVLVAGTCDGELHVIDLLTGIRRSLGIQGTHPKWSPDGTKIAYTGTFYGRAISDSEVFAVNADGSDPKLLTRLGHNIQPDWAPGGGHLTFLSSRDGNWEVYVMNADGSGQTRITNHPATEALPVWRPRAR